MYVRMHWRYSHRYGARTWTIDDWRSPSVRHGIVTRLLGALSDLVGA
jgi:hypothetical protein